MPTKKYLYDYEPLRGPGSRSNEAPEESEFKRRGMKGDDRESDFWNCDGGMVSEELERSVAPNTRTAENSRFLWSLKNGHALSFAGLFIFTAIVFFRPYEFSTSLLWLSKSALVSAIFTILVFIPTQLGLENRITVRPREVNLALILLLLGLLSVPLATDKSLAWFCFVEYFKVVAMFIVMVNVMRTRRRIIAILMLILCATCVLSLGAIKDYLSINTLLPNQRIEGVIGGLFANPNDLALHFVTFFPIVLTLGLAALNPIKKLMYFLVAVLILAGTVVTFSRGGLLGLVFVVGALVWRLAYKNKALVGLIAVGLLAAFLIITPSAYRSRVSNTSDASAEARLGELKRSILITVTHPLLGVGMNNFIVYSNTEHATHNAYTQVSSEIGIPALLAYILFLWTGLKRIGRLPHPRKLPKKDNFLPYLAVGLQASLVGYMVSSFFASVAYLWYLYYLMAYIICVTRLYEISRSARDASIDVVAANNSVF
jgi:putative inorganic carbon (HCO3(-)) transporter